MTKRRDFAYRDDPDTRLAASGNYLRLKMMWSKPIPGSTFTFSSCLEY